jgi:hypothetical protein
MRKYIQQQFQAFLGEMRINELTSSEKFMNYIEKFIGDLVYPGWVSSSCKDKIICCVATLISAETYQKLATGELKQLSIKIHNSLFRFTKSKLKFLSTLEGFRKVLGLYQKEVKSQNNYERFYSHKTMKTNVKAYQLSLEDILQL